MCACSRQWRRLGAHTNQAWVPLACVAIEAPQRCDRDGEEWMRACSEARCAAVHCGCCCKHETERWILMWVGMRPGTPWLGNGAAVHGVYVKRQVDLGDNIARALYPIGGPAELMRTCMLNACAIREHSLACRQARSFVP